MTLHEYLEETGTSVDEFKALIDVKSRTTVYRYLDGRVPTPSVMRRIVDVTGGQVKPGDFYGTAEQSAA